VSAGSLVAAVVLACATSGLSAHQQADADQNVDVVHPDSIPPAPVLSPAEALADLVVETGFEVQLVAAEPNVVDPVALTFDENGAMWIVEMRGYMPTVDGTGEEDPVGRIVVLRDLDSDGRYETSTVFLDELVLPRAIAVYAGGILVAEPPNLLFVERQGYEAGRVTVVDSIYAVGGNAEHQPNGLLVAADNWVYSAKSDVRYRLRDGEWLKETTEYRGQWGITQDDWGRLFYNDNSTTLRGDDFPPNTLSTNPHHATSSPWPYGEQRVSNRVYPSRVTPGVNRAYRPGTLDEQGRLANVTSAAGPVIYRGDNFPEAFRGNAFVQEPAGHLVKRVLLTDVEGRVEGALPYEGREFLTSKDERFRPVNGYTAPDGTLYIVDMYRGVIQHVTYLTDYLRRQIERRGLDLPLGLGRIYRVKWAGTELGPAPELGSASSSELVGHLAHPNGWWRDTSQRLLIERQAVDVRTELETTAARHADPLARFHALWTLEGLGALTVETLEGAAASNHPKIVGAVASLTSEVPGDQADEALGLLERLATTSTAEVAPAIAAAAAAFSTTHRDRAWSLQVGLAARHPDVPLLIDGILGTLEDREAAFVEFASGSSVEAGPLVRASTAAAGLALVTPAAELPVPAELSPRIEAGRTVYSAYCVACHGAEGMGLPATGPPLVRSHWVLQDPGRLVRLVLDGMSGPFTVDGTTYDAPAMPGIMPGIRATAFTDEQLADVLTYVRNSWGNRADAISPEFVSEVRATSPVRSETYTADLLRASETGWTPLFSGESLDGWTALNGTATYEARDGRIIGTSVRGSPNSFLATDREYSDFILELEFLVDPDMNSGIQIRSHSLPEYLNGRVHGYQVEIDPSDRRWTGGLYDEARRGWLFPLDGHPAAQAAFRQGEWNHFRIEAVGDHIRTWVNGVLAADVFDSLTPSGFIALQVHSVPDQNAGARVQWRGIRIKEIPR
jgi:glucose/arabinose dehydrogenase/mono/diheme cytochrome c family protein